MEQSSRGYRSLDMGETARRNGQAEEARRAFGEALFFFRDEGELLGEAQALTRHAEIAHETGDLEWALHEQTEAIALFRKAGDGAALALALRQAGDMFLRQGRLANAAACLQEALHLYRNNHHLPPLDRAHAVSSIARLAEALGEMAEARRYWEEACRCHAALDPLLACRNPEMVEAQTRLTILAS